MDIKHKMTSYEKASAEIEISWCLRIDGCLSHEFEMPLMKPSEFELSKNDELCNE